MPKGGLYSQEIPSFSGGVSQQPDNIRFPNQLQEQINGYSSVVDGLEKRPPLLHIAKLREPVQKGHDKFHFINRDKDEKYVVRISNDDIEVWDLLGNKKEVQFPEGKDYLQSVAKPMDAFNCLTVADYTFILNKEKQCKMTEAVSPDGMKDTSLAYLKNTAYSKTVAIFIDDVFVGATRTPDGSETWHSAWLDTSTITNTLIDAMKGNPSGGSGIIISTTYEGTISSGTKQVGIGWNPNWTDRSKYNISKVGDSTIVITSKDGSRPKISLKDGFGGANFLPIKGFVTTSTKLPPIAPDGYVVHIKGISKGADDDYYVRWDDKANVWKETVEPSIPYQIDAHTMPWALVRQADGHFDFKKLTWEDRQVGDENSNPEPSFIGNTINDIFFYRNRLGLISDESIILSGTSDFFNFWFESAVTVTDTDPIDVAVSSNKVAKLTHAVPFARELMLFSREGQFVLGSDGVLTPKSVKVDQMTAFDYSDSCTPVSIGQNIYFVNDRVDYCSIMRYFTVQDVAELKNAENTTAHVPSYIPKGIRHLAGSSTYDLLLAISESTPEVYVYKYIFNNGQAVQQSWSKWQFNNDIEVLMAEYIDKYIYFVTNNAQGLYLDRMSLTGLSKDFDDEPYRLFMDYKKRYEVPMSATYDDYNGWTYLDSKDIYGSIPANIKPFYVVETDGTVTTIQPEDYKGDGLFIIRKDLRGKVIFLGRPYPFYATLSRIDIKNADGGTVSSETEGRLQIRYFWFNYAKSGAMSVYVVDPKRKQQYRYINTDKDLDVSNCILGTKIIKDGRFKFPVQRQNKDVIITVESRYPTPLNITSGGWEGYYVRRNTRI